jgi:hypothetical protein
MTDELVERLRELGLPMRERDHARREVRLPETDAHGDPKPHPLHPGHLPRSAFVGNPYAHGIED